MKRFRWLHVGFLTSSLCSPLAIADVDAERDALAQLLHELQAIEALVNVAEANASHDSRIRFRYDWLRQDLELMREGIERHLDAPRAQPRSFPPLRGDYRR